MNDDSSKLPLSGVRVLDLSRILAGPWATQLLGDLGADVIKVERPGKGDDTRGWGPPFLTDEDGNTTDAAYFLSANRNKHSVAIDFATEEGAGLVREMALDADILIENFKVGGLRKFGLDWESLKGDHQRLVYCSISGFGQDGPYRDRAGYDYMIQAMGGLMSVTGQPEGTPGGEPMKVGVAVADLFSGMYAATAIMAALRHAERTGEGQHLDVSLFDCQAAMLANQATNYLVSGKAPGRLGNAHPNIAPYQVFESADGFFVIAVGNDDQFARLVALLGLDEQLRSDKRFVLNRDRVKNRAALNDILNPVIRKASTATWLERLEAAGIPAGPINAIDAVFNDDHARTRGLTAALDRPDAKGAHIPTHPVKFSKTPTTIRRAPPKLGADTDDILEKYLSPSDLERLKSSGVIG